MAAPVLRQICWSQFLLFEFEGVDSARRHAEEKEEQIASYYFPRQHFNTSCLNMAAWLRSHKCPSMIL